MISQKADGRFKRIATRLVTCALAICLVAGVASFAEPAYAAAEFEGSTPFGSTGRSVYYHNGRFTGSVIANGVDMSDWQSSKCNLATAKSKGVDFAILRLTWTSYSKTKFSYKNNDSSFASNFKSAKDSGVMTGAYVFSQAKSASEAKKEAKYAISRLKSLGLGPDDFELPIYMDYEFAGGKSGRLYGNLSKTSATAAAKAFCDTIRDAGYTPGIYASTLFFSKYIDTGKLGSDVDYWCAQYYKRCESGINYTKWQYSSTARIGGLLSYLGVKGNIDVNFWYLNKTSSISPNVTVKVTKKYKYTGKAIEPKVTVKNGNNTLVEGVDYVVGGINNKYPGAGYAYIKGIGKYSGYVLKPIIVKPAQTSIISLRARTQGFRVTVKKLGKTKTTGYQVRYSRRSDMEESEIKTIGTKNTDVTEKITTNARKQLYYVQVRSYMTIDGKNYYSAWSDTQTVTSK